MKIPICPYYVSKCAFKTKVSLDENFKGSIFRKIEKYSTAMHIDLRIER